MPTEIERSYIEQGYVPPAPLTWDMVDERRARWEIDQIYAPIAIAPGCVGWGVPHVGGIPLRHP